MEPEAPIDLGAKVPSPETHALLMASAEAREKRRALQLGRLAVYSGITERGRRRPGGPEQGSLAVYDSLTELEFNDLQRAYYRDFDPLFDQFTRGYRVEPKKENIELYVSGSKEQAISQAVRLKQAGAGTPEHDRLKGNFQRQTQIRADLLCRETHINLYTAKLRGASLLTTLHLIKSGQPLDVRAALFAADAIEDFGYSIAANPEVLTRLGNVNFGFKISFIGEQASQDLEILHKNVKLMKLVLREQERRHAFWRPIAEASIKYLGKDRLTKDIKENRAEADLEIDRQRIIRQNIADAKSAE